jgi:hypothetical protein
MIGRLVALGVALVILQPVARWGTLAAQDAPVSAPRTFDFALLDLPVTTALERLAQETGMNLVWQAAALSHGGATRIRCRLPRATPEQALRCITRAAGLDFVRLSTGTYVVIASAESPPAFASWSGLVLDAQSRTPVPSARVEIAGANGARTADNGAFIFTRLPPGEYTVRARAVGYRPLVTRLELAPNGAVRTPLMLERSETRIAPIIVNGIRPGEASAALSADAVAPAVRSQLLQAPTLFLPGAVAPLGVTRRDGTGDLHLQGGDVGEHPWSLDGMPLFDVTALSGLLGVVSPTVVRQLTVHRTGFRASEGSFVAGRIDLEHTVAPLGEGNRREVELHVEPLSAAGRLSAPVSVGAAAGHLMVAGRAGLWDWTAPGAMVRALRHWSTPDPVLLARVGGFGALPGMDAMERADFVPSIGDERLSLADLHSALQLRMGVAHELHASAFSTARRTGYAGRAMTGDSVLLTSNDRYAWHTTGAQLTHRWLLGTRVRQTAQLRTASHRLEHRGEMRMLPFEAVRSDAHEDNGMAEVAASLSWRVDAGDRVDVTIGSDVAHARAHLDLGNRVLRPLAYRGSVLRGAVFSDVTLSLPGSRYVDLGMRVTQLQSGRTYAEPRLAVRGEAGGARPWAWRVGGGGYHQFVNQYDVASTMPVAFVPSLRFWLPSDGRTPVAQAWHLSGESVWAFTPGWELRADLYGRWHPSLPMFDYGTMYDASAPGTVLSDAAQFVTRADGYAAGGGVRLVRDARWREGAWRTEVAYDGGVAARRFPSRFDGARQAPPWLEPHRALLASEVEPWRGVVLASRLRGVWGRPWALRQAYYDLFGAAPDVSGLPIMSPGNMRRPLLADVDVGAHVERSVGGSTLRTALGVTNAFNRANVLDFGLRGRSGDDGYDMVARLLPGRQLSVTLTLRP